jgi:hypothetical protein
MTSNQFLLQIKPYNELFDRLTSPKNTKLILFNHPSNVYMTYGSHMFHSLNIFKKLLLGSIKSLIHAFIPVIFITSTSELIKDIEYDLCCNDCMTPNNSMASSITYSSYASSLPLSPLSTEYKYEESAIEEKQEQKRKERDEREEQEEKQLEYYSTLTKDKVFKK